MRWAALAALAALRPANGIRFWMTADDPCCLLSTTELEPARVVLGGDHGTAG
jgi:hypothetical protein